MSYELQAIKLLQRWAAWRGNKEERRVLQQESWEIIFAYTENARQGSKDRHARYRQRKKERLTGEQHATD